MLKKVIPSVTDEILLSLFFAMVVASSLLGADAGLEGAGVGVFLPISDAKKPVARAVLTLLGWCFISHFSLSNLSSAVDLDGGLPHSHTSLFSFP